MSTESVNPVTEVTHCRFCDGRLVTVLDLGNLFVSSFPLPGEPNGLRAPLDLCRCWDCGMVQLRHQVDPTLLFGSDYWYRSGINETMVAELQSVVEMGIQWVDVLKPHDVVVDIGANDGTLLAAYPEELLSVAYEPSDRWRAYLSDHADIIIPHGFPANGAYRVKDGSAKVVTTVACFYDVADPVAFAREVKRILHPDGVWILQFQDLEQMLNQTAFDNIVHEHLWYYSLSAIERIANETGLKVVYAERRTINGGSLRVVVRHPEKPATASVERLLIAERGCQSWERLEEFAVDAAQRMHQISAVVHLGVSSGQTIDLYGASTKANTWLQAAGFTKWAIRQAWERTPEKVGRETVGTRIPIVSEADGRKNPPDVLLVGAWQFREAFVAREAEFLKAGGTMLFPLPVVDVVQEATQQKKKESQA